MFSIIPLDDTTRPAAIDLIRDNWAGPLIITRGRVHSAENLPGFVAMVEGQMVGLVTYCIEYGECEITSLDSLVERQGIGTKLIQRVIEEAKAQGCTRAWLITTNDNTQAIRFYQKRGFTLAAIYLNAIEASRKLKPQIPLIGMDDIPILHEFEFEMRL